MEKYFSADHVLYVRPPTLRSCVAIDTPQGVLINVYTFHHELSAHPLQSQLVELWGESWSKRGWSPVVLGMSHAEQCHEFHELRTNEWLMRTDHLLPTSYTECLWAKYCAMATMADGGLMADPDVINYGFTPEQQVNGVQPDQCCRDKFNMLQGTCPSLLWGSHYRWNMIVKLFLSVGRLRLAGPYCAAEGLTDQSILNDFYTKENIHQSNIVEMYGFGDWRTGALVHYHNGVVSGDRAAFIREAREV